MFPSRFANLKLESVGSGRPELGVQTILGFDELESTNSWAISNSPSITADRLPLLVVCDSQTAGRGRTGRHWHADSGTLTFSILDSASRLAVDVCDIPRLALVAGLSVAEAIESCVPPILARLKWPNDVLVGGKKVAGVLIENAPLPISSSADRPYGIANESAGVGAGKIDVGFTARDQRIVVGIGVNVSTNFAAADEEVRLRAGSLVELASRPLISGELLTEILQRYRDNVETFVCEGFKPIVVGVRTRCHLTERTVRLTYGGRQFTGKCVGISDRGELEIETIEGRHLFQSGEIVRVE